MASYNDVEPVRSDRAPCCDSRNTLLIFGRGRVCEHPSLAVTVAHNRENSNGPRDFSNKSIFKTTDRGAPAQGCFALTCLPGPYFWILIQNCNDSFSGMSCCQYHNLCSFWSGRFHCSSTICLSGCVEERNLSRTPKEDIKSLLIMKHGRLHSVYEQRMWKEKRMTCLIS